MIKCCIFDLDGTLLYTIPSITYYINKTLLAEGFSTITEDDCRRFIGNGASKLIERSLLHVGAYTREVHARVLSAYNAAYDKDPYYLTEPYCGIRELIEGLRSREIALAVLSNKPDSTTRLVTEHFFGGSFECVMGGLAGIPLKPSPEGTLAVLRELSASPSECAFIGDSDVDIFTGKNAGVAFTLGAAWGFRGREELECAGASAVADTPTDALSALTSLL